MTDRVELAHNAAARRVPSMVNGKPQIPYLGVGKYQPRGRKQAPPIRSNKDYPENGDKRVADLETALRLAPFDASLAGTWAALLHRTGELDQAIAAAESQAANDPASRFRLIYLYRVAGREREAARLSAEFQSRR